MSLHTLFHNFYKLVLVFNPVTYIKLVDAVQRQMCKNEIRLSRAYQRVGKSRWTVHHFRYVHWLHVTDKALYDMVSTATSILWLDRIIMWSSAECIKTRKTTIALNESSTHMARNSQQRNFAKVLAQKFFHTAILVIKRKSEWLLTELLKLAANYNAFLILWFHASEKI